MFYNQKLFVEITKLAKLTTSTPCIQLVIIDVTYLAFYNPKPLFTAEQKPKAAELMQKSLPLIDKGYRQFCVGMHPDVRQNAQISRSGLQYMIDEYKDDQEVYQKLESILNTDGVKRIEKRIQAYTGIPNEHIKDIKMDMSKIPPSHFWWFFVDENDDEEDQ